MSIIPGSEKTENYRTVQEEIDADEQNLVDNTISQPPGLSGLDYDSETDSVAETPVNQVDELCEQNDTLTQPGGELGNHVTRLNAGKNITYTDRESGESRTARILGRTGKATGKLRLVQSTVHSPRDGYRRYWVS